MEVDNGVGDKNKQNDDSEKVTFGFYYLIASRVKTAQDFSMKKCDEKEPRPTSKKED